MAKNGKGKLIVSIAGVSLVAIGMIIAGIMGYADTVSKAGTNTTAIAEHKTAVTAKIDHVLGMQYKAVDEVKKDVEELDRNKVEKEIFQMHIDAEQQKFEAFQGTIKDGFDQMDRRLERIEPK